MYRQSRRRSPSSTKPQDEPIEKMSMPYTRGSSLPIHEDTCSVSMPRSADGSLDWAN
ncbi:hypothetical protein VTO73DRAFT_14311 [Trametes versicolor]